MFLWFIFLCTVGIADHIVYLDRTGIPNVGYGGTIFEPLFNPKTINASIGETIQFLARFTDQTGIPVCTVMIFIYWLRYNREEILYLSYGHLASPITRPPVHFQALVVKHKLI